MLSRREFLQAQMVGMTVDRCWTAAFAGRPGRQFGAALALDALCAHFRQSTSVWPVSTRS